MERVNTEGFENNVSRDIWDIRDRMLKQLRSDISGFRCHSSAMLHGVSGRPMGPIFKGQAVQEESLNLEDRNVGLSRNVSNQLPSYAVQYPRRAKASVTQ